LLAQVLKHLKVLQQELEQEQVLQLIQIKVMQQEVEQVQLLLVQLVLALQVHQM